MNKIISFLIIARLGVVYNLLRQPSSFLFRLSTRATGQDACK